MGERDREREKRERERYEKWAKREREKKNTMEGTVSEKVTAERRGWKKYSPRTIPAARKVRARGRSREAGKTRVVKCHRAMLIYGGREIGGVKLRAEPGNREIFVRTFIGTSRGWLAIKKNVSGPSATSSPPTDVDATGGGEGAGEEKLRGERKLFSIGWKIK